MEHAMNRRSFLKGAAAASAVAAMGAALAGCSSSQEKPSGASNASDASAAPAAAQETSTTAAAVSTSTTNWDDETEVLVVGFGGGGAVAAVTAAEEGAQVMILEKDDTGEGGGSSRMSGGNFMYIKEGMTDQAVKHLQHIMGDTTPEPVIRAYIEEGEAQLDWLDDHDLSYCLIPVDSTATFLNIEGSEAFQCATICEEDNMINDQGGHVFYEWACDQVDALGIEVVFDAAATRLIQNPSTKEILGVQATVGGKEKNIRATRGVVLATGGFSANPTMVSNYLTPAPMKTVACRFATGDAIKMLQRVGADLWHMNTYNMHGYGFSTDGEEAVRSDMTLNSDGGAYLFIDRTGKRWTDESSFGSGNSGHYCNYSFMVNPDDSLAEFNYGRTPFYCIFDESKRLLNPLYFNEVHGAPRPGWTNFDEWSEDNSAEVDKGWILKADTIEELVGLINKNSASDGWSLDPAVVAATVASYNEACEAGVDAEFNRAAHVTVAHSSGYGANADAAFANRDINADDNNLVALSCPPYYAIRLAPVFYTTNGGAVKNEKSQVLDVDGNVIPRLYTAGVDGSITGSIYAIGGQNWGDVLNWGRISGRNVAAETVAA